MMKYPESNVTLSIALTGGDHYTRQGISALLNNINQKVQLVITVGYYPKLESLLTAKKVDILLMAAVESFDYLQMIIKIKARHPDILICMYSSLANSMLWVSGDVDVYISLQDPLYRWRDSFLKMVDRGYQPNKKPVVLSLTPGEWRILKELRNGLDMRCIAEIEKLSYRRVSALKSSAIKKLGLRNKTDLLVFLTR